MATSEAARVDAEKAEKQPRFHWWEREFFITQMTAFLDQIKADETLVPCVRITKDDSGVERVWHFPLATGGARTRANGGDEGFDQSAPCPPLCPPGYP